MDSLWLDLRVAMRRLLSAPGYTIPSLLTLALGIGAASAIYAVVDAVLLRPLPFPDAQRLVLGSGRFSQSDRAAVSPPDFVDFRAGLRSFDRLAGMTAFTPEFALSGPGEPENLPASHVSADFFETLGVAPVLGRILSAADEDVEQAQVVVLSHGLWQRRFGGDPAVVERTLVLDRRPITIVGVMPAGFAYPADAQAWLPMPMRSPEWMERRFHFLHLVGKLAPAVALTSAQAEADFASKALERRYPDSNATWSLRLTPLTRRWSATSARPCWPSWARSRCCS